MSRNICYINLASNVPARDVPYITGLCARGVAVNEFCVSAPGFCKYVKLWHILRDRRNEWDLVWIGFSGHLLPPLVRLAIRAPVVFNAAHSLYEGIVVSRGRRNLRNFWGAVPWFIDFIGFRCVDRILVETNSQIRYCSRLFALPEQKFIRAWHGTNEKVFHPDPDVKKLSHFTVLFRGAFLPESGIMVLAEAARLLKQGDVRFRIIGNGVLAPRLERFLVEYPLPNVEWIGERLSDNDLRTKMLECHLSLGQLADHPRLLRTIPHKAYESIAMGLPYLTARNPGILELLHEGETCLCFTPGDADDLARTILASRNDRITLDAVAHRASEFFRGQLTAERLTKHLIEELRSLGIAS
ncbi:MAG TPA: glycosyltransferase family 4 protein [Candidatus Paceibacterota bacterium]|nr:glycosyltransferase family 4 protein [Candidatus Paceibacterota bacterium]